MTHEERTVASPREFLSQFVAPVQFYENHSVGYLEWRAVVGIQPDPDLITLGIYQPAIYHQAGFPQLEGLIGSCGKGLAETDFFLAA
jgi:hypothetical protein